MRVQWERWGCEREGGYEERREGRKRGYSW